MLSYKGTIADAPAGAMPWFRHPERATRGDALLFGPETRGLPAAVLAQFPPEQRVSIPMRAGNRSLNLSNAVALVAYEAWRQQGFAA